MRHLPNIICLCRIALIWPIIDGLVGGAYGRTLLLFGVAACSDGLDGWLAKRYGWTSHTGSWLDPLADKLLLVSVFLLLTWLGLVPRYLAIAAVGRDVLIITGSAAYVLGWGPLRGRPILSSKINTVLRALAVATFATVAYSGVAYLREFTLRALRPVAHS